MEKSCACRIPYDLSLSLNPIFNLFVFLSSNSITLKTKLIYEVFTTMYNFNAFDFPGIYLCCPGEAGTYV
jgi:hypothetical protein